MRAPYRTSVGQTHEPLKYLSDAGATPGAFGAGIGQGLEQLGAGLTRLSASIQDRQDKTDRFTSLTNFSDFTTRVSARFDELKRSADPSGKGFLQTAQAEYDAMQKDFLANDIPPELRDEFTYRASQVKEGLIGNALDFQYKAGDAYFKQGIADELSKSQVALEQDPSQLDAQRAHMDEIINASDLSAIDKAAVRRGVNIGLEGVTYKGAVKNETLALGTPEGQRIAYRRAISSIESGSPEGNYNAVGPETRLGAHAIGRYQVMDYNVGPWTEEVLGKRMSVAEFKKDHSAQDAVFDTKFGQLAQRYGNPGDAASAWFTGGPATPANLGKSDGNTTGAQYVAKFNAALGIHGTGALSEIDNDPRFSNLPYEERLALRKDAEAEANRALNEQAAANKEQQNAWMNTFLQGIQDGNVGQSEIDNAYAAGYLSDYGDRMKAQNALDAKNAQGQSERDGITSLSDPTWTFNPANEKDMKNMNAVVNMKSQSSGRSLLDEIGAANTEIVANSVIPLVDRLHDIPTDMTGLLTAMVRSNNQSKFLYAMDTLAQIQDRDPRAFNARFGEEVSKSVDMFRSERDILPQDQLMSTINGGTTQEERQRRKLLYDEGKDILTAKVNGVSTLSTLAADVVGDYGGHFSSPNRSAYAPAARALDTEYQTLFLDAYSKVGDKDRADALAREGLKKTWGVTEVGGTLMKYPPEKTGYRPGADGTMSWATDNLHAELGLKPGERFEIISDEQTANEWRKFQAGQGPQPSYQVIKFDAANVPYLVTAPVGPDERMNAAPARYFFQKTAAQDAAEVLGARQKQVEFDVQQFQDKFVEATRLNKLYGVPIPQELVDEKARLDAAKTQAVPDPYTSPIPHPSEPLLYPNYSPWLKMPVPPAPQGKAKIRPRSGVGYN